MAIPPFGGAPTPLATSTTPGKVQLTGDLGNTAASPTVVNLHLSGDTAISHKLTSVTDPTNPQDAATKNYVDTRTPATIPMSGNSGAPSTPGAGFAQIYGRGTSNLTLGFMNQGGVDQIVLTDNTARISYSPTMKTNGVAITLGNGTLTGSYQAIGKTIHCEISMSIGSTTSFNSAGNLSWTLPVTARTIAATEDIFFCGTAHMLRQGVANYNGFPALRAGVTGEVQLFYNIATASTANVTTSQPSTWAYGTPTDWFTLSFTYVAA